MENSPFTAIGDEPVEARIVAWVLGEASAFEVAELERLCAERPELLVFRRRMRALHGLLTEAEAAQPDEGWKLPEEKRKVLDEIFGEEKTKSPDPVIEKRVRFSARRALLTIAACLVLTVVIAGLFAPAGVRQRKRADRSESGGENADMVALSTRLPAELIEGTPKPINVPNLETPVSGPAGSSSWGRDRSRLAEGRDESGGNQKSESLTNQKKRNTSDSAGRALALERPRSNDARVMAEGAKSGYDLGEIASDDSLKSIEGVSTLESKRASGGMGGGVGSGRAFGLQANQAPAAQASPPPPAAPVSSPAPLAKGKASKDMAAADAKSNTATFAAGAARGVGGGGGEADPFAEPASGGGKMDASEKVPVLGDRFAATEEMVDPQPAADSLHDENEPLVPAETSAVSIAGSSAHTGGRVANPLESQSEVSPPADLEMDSDEMVRSNPALTHEHTANVDKVRRSLSVAEGNYNLGRHDDAKREYEAALRTDPYNAAARRGLERIASAKSDYYRAAYDHTRAELLSQVDNAWELSVPADETVARASCPPPAEAMPQKAAGRMPAPLDDEIAATEDPYSTFSLNISDASFQVAQAALAKGERPDPAGIKVEQFYNAVDYGDPAPSAGEPVAVSIEQSAHPVIPGRNLVRVALKTSAGGRSAAQPLRLTLLVDRSGSMVREDRRAAMDKALAGLAGLLTDKDLVTVVGFSRTPRLLADGMSGDKAGKLAELVNQSASEGGTNLEQAIKLAGQLAERRKLAGAQNRIVLFTDGAANLGNADPAQLAESVKQLRQKGIAFDIAGIAAEDLNDDLLGDLARNGNGRYYVVGKGADDNLAKQLAGAFRPAAENVKVQVRFNPERVGRYKLIGFEKDRLKTEDFRNDAVDAAELAAEEAGVAIYQVEPLPGGKGELGEVSVRFRDAASAQMVERTWTIPHDGKAPAFDRATPSMQLAVLSMLAAEKLKGGPLAEAIDFKQLAEPRANVKRFYGTSGRAGEMLHMVDGLK